MSKMQKTEENEQTYDNGFHPHEVKLKESYKFYRKDPYFKFIRLIFIYLTKLFLFIPRHFVWGYKVVGKKNLKGQKSYVMICNHTHPFDSINILISLYPRRSHYMTTLQSNMGFPLVSTYFRYGGAVPIPEDMKLFKKFNKDTVELLKNKGRLIVFPEASLVPYCDHIRPFMQGAFSFAVTANSTIIPTCYTYHKPKGLYKLTRRKKPCMHFNILPPYHIEDMGSRKETTNKVTLDLFNIISNYYNENSDYFKA